MVIYCDASLDRSQFLLPLTSMLPTMRTSHISLQCVQSFFMKALCVLSALTWVHDCTYPPTSTLIYMDSMNTNRNVQFTQVHQGLQ